MGTVGPAALESALGALWGALLPDFVGALLPA